MLSACLLTLILTVSALAFIPIESTSQAASGVNIYVPVAAGGIPVTNAVVNLTDVHTGAVTSATYSAARTSYVASNPAPGFYRVDVSAPNYFNQPGAASVVFTGLMNVTVDPVTMTPFPTKNMVYNVTVTAPGVGVVSGALVGFYNTSHRQFVSTATTNSLGYAVLTMYKTTVATDVSLVVIKSGFETHATPTIVNSNVSTSIALSASLSVGGFVQDFKGNPAQNVVAYLINTDPSVVWVKRVLRTTGNLFSFDAYPGTFTLVVDSPGNNADVRSLTAAAPVSLNIALTEQTQRIEHVDMAFGGNFSQFSLAVATTWSYDDAYPGLIYNDMGSLRAQIDLVMGNGNGVLDSPEITSFSNALATYGTQYVSSTNLLLVNKTEFTNATVTNLNMDLTAGPVTSSSGVSYSYDCAYTAHGVIAALGSNYVLNATARLNSPSVDYEYSVSIPTGYELVQNLTPSGGVVKGYNDVTYESNVTGTGSELIQLIVEKSKVPIVGAAVMLPSQNASSVMNRTQAPNHVERYIVRSDANITFNATGSRDPNGNPLTYIWDFDDGSPLAVTSSSWIDHRYSAAFGLRLVTLTLTDVAGLTNTTQINVTCDGLRPTPFISVLTFPVVSSVIRVNQSQFVVFNGTGSYDDAAAVGDRLGMIAFSQWDFGDGNISSRIFQADPQQNVTHAYERAGDYRLTLNVTDVVGHYRNKSLNVHVNDSTAPVVSFTVKNATFGDLTTENATVRIDASSTRDNVDNYTTMYYSWSLGDSTWVNGTGLYNITHIYQRIGLVTVSLRVQDLSGNSQSISRPVVVSSEPRPNAVIHMIMFSPQTDFPFIGGDLAAGSPGTILINLTNSGYRAASYVVVTVYIVPEGGGALQLIATGGPSQMYNCTSGAPVSSIEPGGQVQIRIPYIPSEQGAFTIRVNVTSDNQLQAGTGLTQLVVTEAIPEFPGLLVPCLIVAIAVIVAARIRRGSFA